jgi:HSP20 family molecular chaperone IbpA
MKSASPLTLALAATLLSSAVIKPTHGHMYGGGGGLGLVNPRRYLYSRRGPHHPNAASTAFDLMSDILSMPVYANSLMRHHNDRLVSKLNGIFDGEGGTVEMSDGAPKYAVTENAEAGTVELNLELPGVVASDLSVSLDDDKVVRIAGRRKHILNGRLYETEFDQSFRLTEDLDPKDLRVTLSSGILRIQATKKVKAVRMLPIVTTEEEVQNVALGSQHSDYQETYENPAANHVDAEAALAESENEITVKDE